MNFRTIVTVVLSAFVFLMVTSDTVLAESGANWPQFRGVDARGVSDETGLPDRWTATENVAWKTDIPGRGWSSPIVWGNRVYLTTAISFGELAPAQKGLYFGGDRLDPPEDTNQWKVYCLDLVSGEILWDTLLHEGVPAQPIHIKNSYASETPVTDGKHVYIYSGFLGVWCLDMDGNEIWSKEIEPHKMAFGWGTAASPMLHEDRLYLVNDNLEDSYLLALDKKTGEELWRVSRDEKSNWSTPYLWENELRSEIITPGSNKVRSYDLEGNLLWSFTGMSGITIATPYAADGLLIVSSGYVGDRRRPLYAIRPGASGDITLAEDETANDWIAWSHPQAAPYNPTTLVYDNRLYVLYDRGSLACFNLTDGSVIYEQTRITGGGNYTASPWAYNGKIFCLNEDGVTFVVKAGDEFEVLHNNPLAEDDMGMATPALVGDRLLIRTSARVYCIQNPGDADQGSTGS